MVLNLSWESVWIHSRHMLSSVRAVFILQATCICNSNLAFFLIWPHFRYPKEPRSHCLHVDFLPFSKYPRFVTVNQTNAGTVMVLYIFILGSFRVLCLNLPFITSKLGQTCFHFRKHRHDRKKFRTRDNCNYLLCQ